MRERETGRIPRVRRLLARLVLAGCAGLLVGLGGIWLRSGTYGLHVMLRHGGTYWLPVATDSSWLSPSMRLALGAAPAAAAGAFSWRSL